MSIIDDLNAGVNSAVKACKNGSESIKNRVKISEQEKIIERMTNEIGNLVLIELDNGKELSPAIMERYGAIKAAREIIAETKVEKNDGAKICPSCGKKTVSDMEYCGYCGTKLEAVEDNTEK